MQKNKTLSKLIEIEKENILKNKRNEKLIITYFLKNNSQCKNMFHSNNKRNTFIRHGQKMESSNINTLWDFHALWTRLDSAGSIGAPTNPTIRGVWNPAGRGSLHRPAIGIRLNAYQEGIQPFKLLQFVEVCGWHKRWTWSAYFISDSSSRCIPSSSLVSPAYFDKLEKFEGLNANLICIQTGPNGGPMQGASPAGLQTLWIAGFVGAPMEPAGV